METGVIHFIHGKESGPSGSKLTALSNVARDVGWEVNALNYSHTFDPATRLKQLVSACSGERRPLLLVGSSMGSWVAAEAAHQLGAHGLFLMAPAVFMPGYPSQDPLVPGERTEIVHGWDDEVIPYKHAVRFAHLRKCTLHLVQSNHRLTGQIPLLCELFAAFLKRCAETQLNTSNRHMPA